MSHDRLRIFLKIIRRQCMILGRHERLEEPPGPACNQPQRTGIGGRNRPDAGDLRRKADPTGYGRCSHPEQNERNRGNPCLICPADDDPDCHHKRKYDTASHAPIHPDQAAGVGSLGLSRCDPFQQPCPCDDQTPKSANDRVGHEPGFMSQKRQRQPHLHPCQLQIGEDASGMALP